MLKTLRTLCAYYRERGKVLNTPAQLREHQLIELQQHYAWLRKKSPFFQKFTLPTERPRKGVQPFGVISKKEWLEQFDETNTAGITLKDAFQVALKAENDREFSPTLKGHTVGLSSGTSGSRAVFVISPKEQAQWAGVILAKLFPRSLPSNERVAFFLRANSNLYTSVRSKRISFEYFDLLKPFQEHVVALGKYQPSIVVAPAQVLVALAKSGLDLSKVRAISVAEVLDQATKYFLAEHFDKVQEVYQATEGLLATPCELGRLHLNEENLFFEWEPVADKPELRIPIITDFRRKAQPLIRYRLNDILELETNRCRCGRASHVVKAIHGRQDDQLELPCKNGDRTVVFADSISRIIATHLPLDADYSLLQTEDCLTFSTTAAQDKAELVARKLTDFFSTQGVDTDKLHWTARGLQETTSDFASKRRRIRRVY